MERLKQYTAVFVPKHIDDLSASAKEHIGQTFTICPSWRVDEEDAICGGRYLGQWACVIDMFPCLPNFLWAPEEDWETIE